MTWPVEIGATVTVRVLLANAATKHCRAKVLSRGSQGFGAEMIDPATEVTLPVGARTFFGWDRLTAS